MLCSLLILPNPIWYTTSAAPRTPMPYVLAVTRFKSLSCLIDLCRSLRTPGPILQVGAGVQTFFRYPSMRLCQPGHAHCTLTPMRLISSRQEGSSRLSLDKHCPISQLTKLPRYRIQKNSNTRTAVPGTYRVRSPVANKSERVEQCKIPSPLGIFGVDNPPTSGPHSLTRIRRRPDSVCILTRVILGEGPLHPVSFENHTCTENYCLLNTLLA
jgi:hypothetical protein